MNYRAAPCHTFHVPYWNLLGLFMLTRACQMSSKWFGFICKQVLPSITPFIQQRHRAPSQLDVKFSKAFYIMARTHDCTEWDIDDFLKHHYKVLLLELRVYPCNNIMYRHVCCWHLVTCYSKSSICAYTVSKWKDLVKTLRALCLSLSLDTL